jgi:hypothetical protein
MVPSSRPNTVSDLIVASDTSRILIFDNITIDSSTDSLAIDAKHAHKLTYIGVCVCVDAVHQVSRVAV